MAFSPTLATASLTLVILLQVTIVLIAKASERFSDYHILPNFVDHDKFFFYDKISGYRFQSNEVRRFSSPFPVPRSLKAITYLAISYIVKLDEQLTEKLGHLALASNTSLYQILLTAFDVQLYRYTNQKA